ncbi:energy transducer TonB [Filimonas effusa]|uniref:TonB C-terminal domain-containing protein n=1 Tax=Filimonas effusa TaxID=2508721 RepID=A0A4Q1D1D9_9BACT|nr:hypothetical protein [Filimonas effusa]RXK80815.1 hypothetical protein ESB13_21905 [Filimonas effusa]
MPFKAFCLSICCLFATLSANAQNNFFEGQITYSRTAHSTSAMSDKEIEDYLLPGITSVSTLKNGNCYNQATGHEEWIIPKEKRAYYKFPKLDTLYYIDFDSDTTTLLEVKKGEAPFAMLRHPCRSISLKTNGTERLFYYAIDLRENPEHSKDNTIGKQNLYARESNGGIALWKKTTFTRFGYGIDSATNIKAIAVDDHVFDRPDLPLKKYDEKELIASPTFPAGSKAWMNYINHNINTSVGAKYIKLKRKQTEAQAKVNVSFAVEIDGTVSEVAVSGDTKGIHPKVIEEALRVIRESPRWIPGVAFGEKCRMHNFQPIIFQVAVE